MTIATRKNLGRLHAQGHTSNYRNHYLEFKEEIDEELKVKVPEPEVPKKKLNWRKK